MADCFRLEFWLCSGARRDVSLRAEDEVVLAGGEAIAEVLFSCSDCARSCLMISALSPFFAFLGEPAHTFVNIATTATAIVTPMQMNMVLLIYAAFPAVGKK